MCVKELTKMLVFNQLDISFVINMLMTCLCLSKKKNSLGLPKGRELST
jgi:hypothetical protein